ncbi:ABC transporter permease [Cohnella phaseoli]|uniref:Putative aldouronate transport system permease protein n=1 Tax=Cohnella phaseoli TaxID=456490 RepID=A0A3D9JQM6_9BACL|nr:ABC transporter permease subunit [Cohnella phaseoli]RED76332.1 putative aldouronate transport system permease protein [Cohnella phaseoli]
MKTTGTINVMRQLKKNLPLTSMAFPGILFFLAFSYAPMFGVVIAFKDYKYDQGILGSEWMGLKNFEFLFSSGAAWTITRNTLFYNSLFIISGTIMAIGLALLLNEVKKKWFRGALQSSYLIPYFISWIVVSSFTYALFNAQNGLLNPILESFHLRPVDWYTDGTYWPLILVIISAWKGVGFNSIIYLAAILGISREYYEAAEIDGANKLRQIWYITLPHIKPLVIILTILAIGKIFYADFGLFYFLTGHSGLLQPVTDVIDTYVFRTLQVTGDVGMASAAGFYQSIVGFVLVILTNYIVRKMDNENALF